MATHETMLAFSLCVSNSTGRCLVSVLEINLWKETTRSVNLRPKASWSKPRSVAEQAVTLVTNTGEDFTSCLGFTGNCTFGQLLGCNYKFTVYFLIQTQIHTENHVLLNHSSWPHSWSSFHTYLGRSWIKSFIEIEENNTLLQFREQ